MTGRAVYSLPLKANTWCEQRRRSDPLKESESWSRPLAMVIQLPRFLATLASRADGQISLHLRLVSILMCIVSLATGVASITLIGGLLLVLPSSFIMFWDLVYLILVALHINVKHPVIIIFELCSWLLAVAMDVLSAPLAFWLHGWCASGDVDDDCDNWKKGSRLAAASWILIILLTIIHFVLFIRAIMVRRRKKRAVANGVPLQTLLLFQRNFSGHGHCRSMN
ncbi:hypothetical protein PILCRDRAFT_588500 [Piloderma croceum F 1598]|uniref:MARVEL domain-containing protein n=1 Tax=Piloderma croceum (strain F 1598) TaxID=765440 RepID=A0A0C3AWR4_PILCF|nr:hypothetical protein PILCRDRAFT_588500 [Piloderma croceum F 1598]